VVITEEQAIKLLSEANPVPDPSTLDVNGTFPATRLAEYDARSKVTRLKTYKPKSRLIRRRVIVGAAAVAAVTLGILIVPGLRGETPVAGQPVATTAVPTTAVSNTALASVPAVEIAEAFLEAYYGRFDVDEAFAYLGTDPEAVGLSTAGAADYHQLARFFQETGSQLVDLQCEELGASASETVVSCTWFTHNFLSDLMGKGPFGPDVDEFTIVDGLIVSIVDRTDMGPNEFSNQIWEPFADWIAERHPDDQEVMYNPFPNGWRITDESIPVWEQRLREYAAEIAGQEAP
jgi:hypothetical protein